MNFDENTEMLIFDKTVFDKLWRYQYNNIEKEVYFNILKNSFIFK